MKIPETREEFIAEGIEILERYVEHGDFASARAIIDKNRRQARIILEETGNPSGRLAQKLSICQERGWIDDLYTEGDFSGPLLISKED